MRRTGFLRSSAAPRERPSGGCARQGFAASFFAMIRNFTRAALLACALAAPLAAQTPSADPIAAEGIVAPLPEGFPPLMPADGGTDDPRHRGYRSMAGERIIVVTVMDGIVSWGGDDLEARRGVLEQMAGGTGNGETERLRRWEDSTHLGSDSRVVRADGWRGIARTYVPRTGSPKVVRIFVLDEAGAPDPADDPGILAFLDAARPWPHLARPVALTFRASGVEMDLPPGLVMPRRTNDDQRSDDQGIGMFYSRSGDRHLIVMINEIREAGATLWPPERRIRDHRQMMDRVFGPWGIRIDEPVRTEGVLASSDLRFDRLHGRDPGAGVGRVYSRTAGPNRMITVLYFEEGAERVADEAEVLEMLDSLRLTGPARR